MTDFLSLALDGVDGSHWDLAGPAAGRQNVTMRTKAQQLIDSPAKTFWIKSATGTSYQGFAYQRRDPLFSVQIHGDGDIDVWQDVDSQFRMALGDPDDTFTLTATTSDGARTLTLRLLEQPKSYETADYEDRDPHIWGDCTVAISAACEQPHWVGTPFPSTWFLPSGTSGSGTLTPYNPGDVPIWATFTCTAPALWTLDDRSWGSQLYGRAVEDAARTVPLPVLLTGEDLDIDANPDVKTLVAANGAPVAYRWNGGGILYPIAKHTPKTPVVVTVSGAPTGAAISMTCTPFFSRPWGVSR